MRKTLLLAISSLIWSHIETKINPWKDIVDFEGDILPPKNPGPLSGHTSLNHHNHKHGQHRRRQEGPTLWPNGVVPIKLDPSTRTDFTDSEIWEINKAIGDFSRKTCIKFKKVNNERSYVKIVRLRTDECSSNVGKVGGVQELRLGSPRCFDKSVIIHELMHALGFYHEHNRKEAQKYIDVIFQNLRHGQRVDWHWHTKHHPVVKKSRYDICSIMHYGAYAGSTWEFGDGRAIVDKFNLDRHCKNDMGFAKTFSKSDLKRINKMYRC